MIYGLDYLGLGSKYWPLKTSIKHFPKGWAVGCFDTTFGPYTKKHLKALLDTGKVAAVRVHIWWSYQHKIVPLSVLRERVPVYDALSREYPNVLWAVSHSCEYDEPSRAVIKKRLDLVRALAPLCAAVNCAWRGPRPAALQEGHGIERKLDVPYTYIWSADGDDLTDNNAALFAESNKSASMLFSWGALFNMQDGHQPADPTQRKSGPCAEYIGLMSRLCVPRGIAPDAFPGAIRIVKPKLYKPCSRGTNDSREWKPVLIVPSRASSLDVLTKTGKTIGKFMHYSGDRFYSGMRGGIDLWGHEIAKKAATQSGSEFIWFRDNKGNKIYGPVHPAFRVGYFR